MNLLRSHILAGIALLTVISSGLMVVAGSPTVRADIQDNLCGGASLELSETDSRTCQRNDDCVATNSNGDCTKRQSARSINNLIATIVNILSVIVGLLAVVFIIIAGFRFVSSGGDSGKVASARSTIVYAIVGLIIVALAQVIVRFVLNRATNS